MDNQQLLEEYSKELNVGYNITLPRLIESHKFLREQFQKTQRERKEEINNAIQQGINFSLRTDNYIKIEDLLKMSLQEICNNYYEEE